MSLNYYHQFFRNEKQLLQNGVFLEMEFAVKNTDMMKIGSYSDVCHLIALIISYASSYTFCYQTDLGSVVYDRIILSAALMILQMIPYLLFVTFFKILKIKREIFSVFFFSGYVITLHMWIWLYE